MRFEELFQEPELGFGRIVDNMPDALIVFDRTGKLEDANGRASESLGYSKDELLALTLWDITHGFSPEEFSVLFQPAPGTPLLLTGFARSKQGQLHPVRVRAWAHRSGETERILAIVEDITEDELTRRELEDSEERFRKISEHSNDAICVIDPANDRIMDVNPKACSMLGYSRNELLSIPISAIHPHEMGVLRSFVESVSRDGNGWTDELSCLTKGGRTVPAEISASMIEIDNRMGVLALIRDISDRKNQTTDTNVSSSQVHR
jgi:PAS domain S-box-containing protein